MEVKIQSLIQQNAELANRLAVVSKRPSQMGQMGEENRRMGELEEQIQQFQVEYERAKKEAMEMAGRYDRELKNRGAGFERKVTELNNHIEILDRENAALKNRLEDKPENLVIEDYDRRISGFSKEIERLNGILRMKIDEATSW